MDYDIKTEAWELNRRLLRAIAVVATMFLMQSVHAAESAGTESDPKTLSGMAVIGSDEAPKSLFIVPWKTSEIGFETDLDSGMMDDSIRPVDRDVFMRQIDFYEIRHAE